jgi:hypothetical protein
LNQNNRNNNRRRGRGNNRGGQGGGGGNQGNRIDSRARGNAPQMLEKYKKLAHDASLNGDRVQTEYFLQFADHYFRVVADSRVQRDEQRPQRGSERDPSQGYDYEDEDELEGGPPAPYQTRREREREDEAERAEAAQAEGEGQAGAEGEPIETPEAAANPFTPEPRRGRRPRNRNRDEAMNGAAEQAPKGFDPGVLPPSIAQSEEAEQEPRPRRRRTRPTDDGDSEALEAVG